MKCVNLLMVLYITGGVVSYPRGPPSQQQVCMYLQPSSNAHGTPQTSKIPYTLTVKKSTVSPGEEISVLLSKKTEDGPDIKGFIIQSRNDKGDISGVWSPSEFGKSVECGGQGTIGHSNPENKKRIEFRWKALEEGFVNFSATILQNKNSFWTEGAMAALTALPSTVGEVNAEPEPEVNTVEKLSGTLHRVYEGCNRNKGCFGFPSHCLETFDCSLLVSYSLSQNKDSYTLDLHGLSDPNGYLAVGFSSDETMGEDLVVSCRSQKSIVLSWNIGHSGSKDILSSSSSSSLKNVTIVSLDGYTTCSCLLNGILAFEDNKDPINLLTDSFFVLLASGKLTDSSSLTYHDFRIASDSSISLASSFTKLGVKSDVLFRLHGIFMVLAWISSASLGLMLARYYRNSWNGKKLFGNPIWFTSHRSLMALSVLFTVVAFILILIELQGWPYTYDFIRSNPHPAFGLATILLSFLQPLMAFFRPHPGSEKRWIFNWSHWFVGNSAYVFGIVAIFLSVELLKAGLPYDVTYVLSAFVILQFLVHCSLSILSIFFSSESSNKTSVFPLRGLPSENESSVEMESSESLIGKISSKILIFYTFIVGSLSLFLIIVIAIAPKEF